MNALQWPIDMSGSTVNASTGVLPVSGAPLAHAALALGGFAIGTAEFATMSFLPAFTSSFGVDAPTGGHVISAYALGVVVGAPLLAVVGARTDRRYLLLLLLAWFALGNGLSALASSFESLVVLRFFTAIPHGGYFGVAILCAVGMVPQDQHATAVGRVIMGLALATVTGVPLASLISQWMGWRYGFGAIGILTLSVAALIWYAVPPQAPTAGASAFRELGALRRSQVWLSLAIGAVGFGGLFAVYTYLASTLQEVTHVSGGIVSLILAAFGAGMAAGNFVAPRLAKLGTMPAAGLFLAWSFLALATYPLTVSSAWAIGLSVFGKCQTI
ncbi:DHA1 family inner membrane transport protein [Oxalobacteraceae bacterium GrIS 1.11]